LEAGQWKPSLVILRLNRGCTSVKWSPKEDKFAVGSAAAAVSVCYYVPDQHWWLSKLIKGDKSGINSTITCIAWHPNNILVAAGGTDSKTRVFSGFVKDLDDRNAVANGTAFGSRLPFAALLAEFPTSGWVHSLAFSPSGTQLAWTTHDSSIHILDCSSAQHTLQTIKCRGLPYVTCIWAGENSLVVAGHDCVPVLFQGAPGTFQYVKDLDSGDGSGQKTNKNVWENRTELGTEEAVDVGLPSRHQNKIIELSVLNAGSFSSVGWDGNMVIWPYAACGAKVQ
jgi:actin related protein 2/3 complex subunit 1A/1B